MKKLIVFGLAVFLILRLEAGTPMGMPEGKGELTVGAGERAIQVYTYKPKGFSNGPIFFVFHGAKRNAEDYRNWTIPLAEKYHAIVAAPFFDQDRFLAHLYSWGGILSKDGKLRDSSKWSFPLATEVIQSILKGEGDMRRDHYLLGHSGGAQFLTRYVAMESVTAKRVIAANAGTYPFPRIDWDWGYGFGNLPKEFQNEDRFKKMLGTPMTIYLGLADTSDSTETGNFDASDDANRQGKFRLERGRNFFKYGEKLAKEKGWKFNWTEVEVPDVGHDANLMFNDLRFEKAIGIRR
jgi:poly(3-hydroxybutyrate) depolymerase